MKQLIAANDNRATWDSERPIACPTLVRFIRLKDTTSITVLIYWRDLTKPGDPYNPNGFLGAGMSQFHCAEDIDEDLELATRPQPERELNQMFSPKEHEYIEAAANDNKGRPTFDSYGQAHLGGLTFRRGKCVTPGVFNDEIEFGKIRKSKSVAAIGLVGEEAFSTSFEAELVRAEEERSFREQLGDLADVLDMACCDYTAEQIGRMGDESQSAAERRGKRRISDAIDLFLQIKKGLIEKAA